MRRAIAATGLAVASALTLGSDRLELGGAEIRPDAVHVEKKLVAPEIVKETAAEETLKRLATGESVTIMYLSHRRVDGMPGASLAEVMESSGTHVTSPLPELAVAYPLIVEEDNSPQYYAWQCVQTEEGWQATLQPWIPDLIDLTEGVRVMTDVYVSKDCQLVTELYPGRPPVPIATPVP